MKNPPFSSPTLLPLPYSKDTLRYFHAIHKHLPMALLLQSDSAPTTEDKSTLRERFDILTASPEYWLQIHHGMVTWNGKSPPNIPIDNTDNFSTLRQLLDQIKIPELDYENCIKENLPFCGGLIGYCSYDLNRENLNCSGIPPREIDIPDMQFGFYGWACIQDHATQKCWLVIHPSCDKVLAQRLPELLSFENQEVKNTIIIEKNNLSKNLSFQEYKNKFEKIKYYIESGDCYQVNLSQKFTWKTSAIPIEIYEEFRNLMPNPFSAFLPILGGNSSINILSFSPERFIKVNKNGLITTQPIKGSSERFSDKFLDMESARQLKESEKCIAENLMIVDLLRNDLGRVCEIGSIQVSKLFELQSFSNVHHLVSTVQGKLRDTLNAADILQACFPGGSITGAPKIRAMEIINELEPTSRSIYCGSIIMFSTHGTMDSNILIRTILLEDGTAHCWAGGGIVADSDCVSEYKETLNKVGVFLGAIR